jgi:hypothetical protein
VLARIVENWLTSAGELGYQAAFAQLLVSEGCRVLHAPVHHPNEHGKDLVALAPDGALQAYQLKGGDIGLSELERLQGQLFALAGTAVTYPGIEPPRPPDRVFLVTNGRLTPPARDRLRSFNDASRQRGFPAIETIECDQLVSRLVEAHGTYLPRELRDLNKLLALVLATGEGPFPVRDFAEMLWILIDPQDVTRSARETRRVLASAAILTSYATGPWHRFGNHLGVAEGWLVLAFSILRCAELHDLEEDEWSASYGVARDSARRALALLFEEATSAQDLVIPDHIDGLIYPVRATVVCGYAAAYFLSERWMRDAQELDDPTRRLLLRELEYLRAPGEAGTPFLLLIATALEILNEHTKAVGLVLDWARALTITNAPGSEIGAPDPYHPMSEILLHELGGETELDEEQFAGEAYTLHIALDWFARRGGRIVLEKLWPAVTRIHFAEFCPSAPANLMAHDDPAGRHHTWAPAAPASWAKLVEVATTVAEQAIPDRLWQQLGMLPYLPLIYPYRLTREVATALDYMTTGRAQVELVKD